MPGEQEKKNKNKTKETKHKDLNPAQHGNGLLAWCWPTGAGGDAEGHLLEAHAGVPMQSVARNPIGAIA